MRKLFIVLLIASFLVISGVAFATEGGINPSSDYTKIKTYTIVYVNGTANVCDTPYAGELISSSYIKVGTKIIGFTLTPNNPTQDKNAGISLWDSSTLAAAGANSTSDVYLIVEAEAKSGENAYTLWFPYPYKVERGLVVRGGDSGFVLTIFYIEA